MRLFRPRGATTWTPPLPSRRDRGAAWETGEPASPWTRIAQLTGEYGATAISGQILGQDGLPLAGITVSIEGTKTTGRSDEAGRFLLSGLPAGHHVLVIEGETAAGRGHFGTYEVGVNLTAHQTLILPYTIWLTPLDPAGNHSIPSPTTTEERLTTPQVPGLEVRLPAGSVITNAAGHVVHHLNITAIPVDRPPFLLPPFVTVPVYFTIQPGRAYLSKGAQIIYPNWAHLAPGERVDFWNYDPDTRGWYVYGKGTVTPNGTQIMPDPGVRVWEFTGAMITKEPLPPKKGPKPGASAGGGDPVDLGTGLFTYHKTDLALPGAIPIVIERTYRQGDTNSYSFGIGMSDPYEMRLWSENNYHEADLILPDGGRVHYVRTSSGEGFREAIYESTNTPGAFYASTIKWNEEENGWDLTLTNGLTYEFGENAPLEAIHDRFGNKVTLTRAEGRLGNIIQITNSSGRWIKLTYDGSNRITQITDNGGRTLKYEYAGGYLEKATDAAGRVTSYEYKEGAMTAIKDGRGNTYLENEYNEQGLVKKQKMADGGTYSFVYTTNLEGRVESATETDPRGTEKKVTYNSEGFPTSEINALGTSIEQTTKYEPEAKTGLPLSVTDPHGRKTTFKYDSAGNITQVTALAGTTEARTTEYTYEPGTTEVATVTDPLKHKTTYHYGAHGELISKTDPLGHKTTYEYNAAGQVIAITNALGKTTKLTYEFGDLTAITDPLGRKMSAFIDGLGRTGALIMPGGQRTLHEYNLDNQLTKETDPLGASTTYEYDNDGDLTSTTDPKEHKSTATYDAMDRLESDTDALEHTTKATRDHDGNITELDDRNGKVDKFTYDALNRMTEARFGVSGETAESTIKYTWDNGDRLTKVEDSATGTYTPKYDEFNNLKSLETPAGTISYEYNADNLRKSMTITGIEANKYEYDEADRLTEVKHGTQAISFEYDEANRPTKTTLVDGIEESYGYDEANELTSIAYTKGKTKLGELDYAYTPNSLREAVWGSYARTGLPEAITSTTYNADNELTERNGKKLTYDGDGNLASDGSSEYKWNARDQLTEITGANTASFSYDPFGRRVSKTLGGSTTKVLYDGANAAQETHGTARANMLTGLDVDQTLARTTTSGTESFLTDALGSTIALGGSTGKAETTYTYDPFGTTTKEGAASENPFQYAGREYDGAGIYYNRARYYGPASGRFLSQDPLGQEANGPNVYRYTDNSPTNATDPYGTDLNASTPTLSPAGGTNAGPGSGHGPNVGLGYGGASDTGAPDAIEAPGGVGYAGPSTGAFGPGPAACHTPQGKGHGILEQTRCRAYLKLDELEERNRAEDNEEGVEREEDERKEVAGRCLKGLAVGGVEAYLVKLKFTVAGGIASCAFGIYQPVINEGIKSLLE